MKRLTNTKYLISNILILLIMLPIALHAQPGFEDDTRDVPVDGGLSILVAAGGAYVLRRKQIKKEEQKQ